MRLLVNSCSKIEKVGTYNPHTGYSIAKIVCHWPNGRKQTIDANQNLLFDQRKGAISIYVN